MKIQNKTNSHMANAGAIDEDSTKLIYDCLTIIMENQNMLLDCFTEIIRKLDKDNE